jgi:hypothetical protein
MWKEDIFVSPVQFGQKRRVNYDIKGAILAAGIIANYSQESNVPSISLRLTFRQTYASNRGKLMGKVTSIFYAKKEVILVAVPTLIRRSPYLKGLLKPGPV